MATHIRDRRKYSRIEKSFRVEYVIDGRRSMAFAVNMSMGGMLLRSASQLAEGNEVDFMLALPGAAEPLTLQGKVLGRAANQARIAFTADQSGLAQLRSYFETVIFPELETALDGPRLDTVRLLVLARLYADFNRIGDALALYRSQRTAVPNDMRLLEQMALFLLQLAEATPPYSADALPELESVIIAGLALEPSEVLSYVKRSAEEMLEERRRQQQELAAQVEQKRQNERLAEELRNRGEQLDVALAERRRTLEEEFLQRAAAAHAEMQQAMAADRAALAQAQAALQTERAALAAREESLAAATAAENSRMTAVFAELAVKQAAMEQQKLDLAEERATWLRQRGAAETAPMAAGVAPAASAMVVEPAAVVPPLPTAVPVMEAAEVHEAPAEEPREVPPNVEAAHVEPIAEGTVVHGVEALTTDPNFQMPVGDGPTNPGVAVEEWISEPADRPQLMTAAETLAEMPSYEEEHDPQADAVTMQVTVEEVGLAPAPAAAPPVAPSPAGPSGDYFSREDEPVTFHDSGHSGTDEFDSMQLVARQRRRVMMGAGAAVAGVLVLAGIVHVAFKPAPVQSTVSSFSPDGAADKPPEKPVVVPPPEPIPAHPKGAASAAHGKHPKASSHGSAKKTKTHKHDE